MLSSHSSSQFFHQTTLQQIITSVIQKWNKAFLLDYNHLFSNQPKLVTDEAINELTLDIKTRLRLHRWDFIDNLDIKLTNCEMITPKTFKIILDLLTKNFKHLKQLSLHFIKDLQEEDEFTKALQICLDHQFKNLKSFSLDLSLNFLSDNELQRLGSIIGRNMRGLESLALNLTYNTEITEKGLVRLVSCLQRHLNLLKDLSLDFTKCLQITERGLELFAIELSRKFPKLTQLKLSFAGCKKLSDRGLYSFGIRLGRAKFSLEQIVLNFEDCESITDKGINYLLPLLSNPKDKLNTISLNFSGCKHISDVSLFTLSDLLKQKPTKMRGLSLNFNSCKKITDQGFQTLWISISHHIEHFKILSLNFGSCENLTGKSVGLIGSNLLNKTATNLVSLTLIFQSWLRVSDTDVENLIKGISATSKNLKSLTLNFYSCKQLTDVSLKTLGQEIGSHLQNLKHLTLNLDFSYQFTDQGLETFSTQVFPNLLELSHLTLTFAFCREITEKGLKALELAINNESLRNLESLDLSFESCMISDGGLNEFGVDSNCTITKLKSLHLRLYGCSLITDEGVMALASNLQKNFPKLLHLALKFRSCRNIIQKIETRDKLYEILQNNGKLDLQV